MQIETGVLLGYEGDQINTSEQQLLPTTLFRYGLIDKVELRILSQFENNKSCSDCPSIRGISDIEIGAKIKLYQGNGINVAFLSHVIVPTGSHDLSLHDNGSINKLALEHDLTDNISIGYNAGYDYFGEGNGDLTYSVAIGVGINDKVGIYIEPYGAFNDLDKYESNFDAGFTYSLKKHTQLDFSFGTGLNHDMNYISLGASFLFVKP